MVHRFPTYEEIVRVAHVVGAKRAAVEDFISSLDVSMPQWFHLKNLNDDAVAYGWGKATIDAIKMGIKLAYTAGR